MSTILTPGFLKWDGTKYVLDPDVEGEPGPPGADGEDGAPGAASYPPTTSTQMVWVSKGGNDGTANGSPFLPYLTIQAAIDSVADAASNKRYIIMVGPGDYAEALTFKPWIWIRGAGQSNRETTLSGTSPSFHSSWNTTAILESGIANVTLAVNWTADLALAGSTKGRFRFLNVRFERLGSIITSTFIGQTSGVSGTQWSFQECEFPVYDNNNTFYYNNLVFKGGYFQVLNCSFANDFLHNAAAEVQVRNATGTSSETYCMIYGGGGSWNIQAHLDVAGYIEANVSGCSNDYSHGGRVTIDCHGNGAFDAWIYYDSDSFPFANGYSVGSNPILLNGATRDNLITATDAAALNFFPNTAHWTFGTRAYPSIENAIAALAQAVFTLRGNVKIPLLP